jgi:hypothetical protein
MEPHCAAMNTVVNGLQSQTSDAPYGGASDSIEFENGTILFANFPLSQINVTVPQSIQIDSGVGTFETRLGSTALTGQISGPGELQFLPDPSWPSFTQSEYTISNTNNYSGGTVLGAVTVTVTGTNQSLGGGEITVENSGVLSLASASNLGAGQLVALQPGGVLVINDATINPAQIVDTNPANTTGGILSLGVNYSSSLNMSAVGNGQIFLGSSQNVTYTGSTLGAGAGGVYRLGGGSLVGGAIFGATLTFSGTDNLFTGTNSMIVGSTAGTTSSDAIGATTVALLNTNNYSGGTTLAAGTLTVGNDHAMGSGPLNLTGGSLAAAGAPHTISNAMVVSSNSPEVFFGSSTVGSNFALTLAGTLDLGGGTPIFFSNVASGTATFSNTISDGGLMLDAGAFKFSGTNTFGGGLTITASATLEFSSDTNLGFSGVAVTLDSGILKPDVSLSLSRPLTITRFGAGFNTNGQTLTLTGTVTNAGGTVTKTGAGTLIVSGSAPALGTVAISQGEVEFNNGTNGNTTVNVQNGGILGGTGSVGFVTLQLGGHVAPGGATPGSLFVNTRLNLTAGADLDFRLGTSVSDEIVMDAGFVGITNNSSPVLVNISDAGGLAPGQVYPLINWSNANESGLTTSEFQVASGPVGGTFSIVNNTLELTTTGVPEPSSLALLMGPACLLVNLRRRRR